MASDSTAERTSRQPFLLFVVLVFAFCAWTWSLPLFPTQDGPIHKYYVHVLGSLLAHANQYPEYAVRHPFPPYATHYAVLLGFSKFLSLDSAEKLFICIIIACTAFSFRYCARALGPAGDLTALCMLPLTLHWSLLMGFLNYSLGVALFFLAAGLWVRASAGRAGLFVGFAGVALLLMVTHPVPLLMLLAFCSLELALRLVQHGARAAEEPAPLKTFLAPAAALGFALLCFLYPLASADRSRSLSNLHTFGLHRDAFISSLALFGVSPFDTRASSVLINTYRAGLYLLLPVCLVLAARGFVARWRERALRTSDVMLIGTVALLIAIPVLPPSMNGSDFFAPRLMIFVWLGALAAASGNRGAAPALRRAAPMFATAMAIVTLLAANIFLRPVARQLLALEQQTVPTDAQGLSLMDPGMLKATRVQHQLGFQPYLWSGALPLIRARDVMLNSPFMDQTITPLRPTGESDLMVNEVGSADLAEQLINGNVDLPSLPAALRTRVLRSTQFIVYVATPSALQMGLPALIGQKASLRYACAEQAFYMICTLRVPARNAHPMP